MDGMQDAVYWKPLIRGLRAEKEDRDVRILESCNSTNMEVRNALSGGAGAGLLVLSEMQTAGKGRLGRKWVSDPGSNLLFSLALKPDVALERMPRCVLLWAAAMAEVLDCRLKWPNDLQDGNGRKLGGILSELYTVDASCSESWMVILGVGINVNQENFTGLPDATSLSLMRGKSIDRAGLLLDLVRAIERVDPDDPDGLNRWRERSDTLGRQVRIGNREGRADGIREDGALMVDGHPILAGDVELVGGL